MLRMAIVLFLVLGLMANGCASRQTAPSADADSQQQSGGRPKWVRYDDWGDEHPFLNMTAKSACYALVGIGVLALVVGLVILEAHGHD